MSQNIPDMYYEDKNHTPDAFPYNTYLCSIPLDFPSVKTHWHNETEIIVVKKGRGIVHVDLQEYHVQAGEAVFLFPGQLHAIEQDADFCMEYENILFKPELLTSSGAEFCTVRFIKPLLVGVVRLPPLVSTATEHHAAILHCIDEIDCLCDARPFAWQLGVKGLLFQILSYLLRGHSHALTAASNQKSIEKIKGILRYVEQNYSSRITIAQAAESCYYSESYFMKFFKRHMGVGFIQYLNDYRLELAAEQLISTDAPILTIAGAVGFDNLSYFNRSFKKKYHMTPAVYRKHAHPVEKHGAGGTHNG